MCNVGVGNVFRTALLCCLALPLAGCFEESRSESSSATAAQELTAIGRIERIAHATVGWDAPAERVDGSPIGSLSAFRIYYGTTLGALDQLVTVTDPAARSARVYRLTPGTWYFAVTAVDAEGMESERSAVASKTIS